MTKGFILLAMIFCHIVDDYYLQGWLASAKQKEWWKKNSPQKMYKADYICALMMHAFSWTFMTMLPIAIYYKFNIPLLFLCLFGCNWTLHALVDDMKANKKLINLWQDQTIHIFQICCTAAVLLSK